jgi:hypothetical protein
MPDIHSVESILALVTNRDQAAAIAGDLAERGETRNAIRCWFAVLRIATSLLWRSIAEAPMRVTRIALLGAAADVAAGFFFAFLSGFIFFAASSLAKSVVAVPPLVTSLVVGRILARRAVDREIAASAIYVLLAPLIGTMVDPPQGLSAVAIADLFLLETALRLPAVAGAVLVRRRRLRAA